MFGCSVIICTRNPRKDYFIRVLNALKSQTFPKDKWELLLLGVPENGTFDFSWHPNSRHVPDLKIGLAQARMAGMVEANSELLIFVDDDNVLRSDYLENAVKLSETHPEIGAFGGSCIPEFETEPATELGPYLGGLLIKKQNIEIFANLPYINEALPPGAGMVVRKKQAIYYRKQAIDNDLRNSLGPHNKPPRGADDSDLALSGLPLGLGYGMFPELELTHLIGSKKLNIEFLEKLWESFGYGGTLMEAIHNPQGIRPMKTSYLSFKPSKLKILALTIVMLFQGKNRVDKRIRLAKERGYLRALNDLRKFSIRHPFYN